MITYIDPSYGKSSNPRQSSYKMHTHPHYEILLFLSGDADYAVEGNVYRLHSGDMMIMSKLESHHLVLRSDADYERMVIHFNLDDEQIRSFFDTKPLGRYNLFKAADIPDRWKFYIEKACVHGQHFYLLPLVYEISECGLPDSEGVQDRAHLIIKYINDNLENELSLDGICEKFYISKTHLNRVFKKIAGTTVWDYITTKRLFLAKRKIAHGSNPTDVFLSSGFTDYTTFFRAYKKQFGESPKAQKVRSN